jgi:hypothetical protein
LNLYLGVVRLRAWAGCRGGGLGDLAKVSTELRLTQGKVGSPSVFEESQWSPEDEGPCNNTTHRAKGHSDQRVGGEGRAATGWHLTSGITWRGHVPILAPLGL